MAVTAEVSIVVPTVKGREGELTRTMHTYTWLTPVVIEWVIERDHPTCGAAWNAGVARATCEIVHITADDLEPTSTAWYKAGLWALGWGYVPLGWIREDPSARFGCDFCRVPMCKRDWWRPVSDDMHYYTDNQFTDEMWRTGHAPAPAPGYDFYHRRSMVGRGAGMTETERVEHDHALYEERRHGV